MFIPLFFINIRDSHDWGDDFAQYIHQAANIIEGKPQNVTGYIFNPDQPFVGPPVYSVGFPLILAPVYACAGNRIMAFDYLNTAVLCLLGMFIIYFMKKQVGELTAVFISLIIIYNPWTLSFKCEVVSDLSFSLFLLGATFLYLNIDKTSKNIYKSLGCGILVGFLILIKSTGVVLLAAMILDGLITSLNMYRDKRKIKSIQSLVINLGIILATALIMYFTFNDVLFNMGNITLNYFKFLYQYEGITKMFLQNVAFYIKMLQYFFHPQVTLLECLPLIVSAFTVTFFILGLINEVLKKTTFLEIFLLSYLIVICIFPNSTQGIRYLFPAIPFIMYYVVKGMQSFKLSRKINSSVLTIGLSLVCLSYYYTGITHIIREQPLILSGPQEKEANEVFNFIKQNTKTDDTIVFIKPRALSLYSGRNSFTNHPGQDTLSLNKKFDELKPRFFLLSMDIDNPALNGFIKSKKADMLLRFKNSKFEFFQRINH